MHTLVVCRQVAETLESRLDPVPPTRLGHVMHRGSMSGKSRNSNSMAALVQEFGRQAEVRRRPRPAVEQQERVRLLSVETEGSGQWVHQLRHGPNLPSAESHRSVA